jgi:hypothetical protein
MFARPEPFGRALLLAAGPASRAAPLPVFRCHDRTLVTLLYFCLFPIVIRIVFPLIPIVLASAAFLSSAQGLAL